MIRKVYGDDEKIPGECPYDRCAYKGCKNGKYRNFRKLFLFPRHTEPERLEQWLKNCDNEELRSKAYSSIRRSGICADHFEASCFSDVTRYFLKRNSVPLPNYPPELLNNSLEESTITSTTSTATSSNNENTCKNQAITRVPRLFEDFDDNIEESDENSSFHNTVKEENEIMSVQDDMDDSLEPPHWKRYEVFLSDNEGDFQYKKNPTSSDAENSANILNTNTLEENAQQELSIEVDEYPLEEHLEEFSPVAQDEIELDDNESQATLDDNFHVITTTQIVNKTKVGGPMRTIVNTEGASVEQVRQLHRELKKDDQLKRLRQQNSVLRKELRRLKNLERLRKQRKSQKAAKKKLSLKEQKKLVLETVKEMDISPVSKAIISLQLHTKNAPYTEEEKNLATEFLLYSRSGFKRLKNAGLNFPSASSLKRWVKSIREQDENFAIEIEDDDEEDLTSPILFEDSVESNPEN